MLAELELFAPAKINLTLAVKGRRDDGFHEIESVVAPITLFDRLHFAHQEAPGIAFHCSDPSLPVGADNLVVRAASLFCQSFGFQPNLRIELEKRIPHGAGLGGGSSDAASTLLALNALFAADLPRPPLVSLAAELGSDVPVFIQQSPAVMRGRGDIVEKISLEAALPLLLVKPPFGVPTPWAYSRWRDSRPIPGVSYSPQAIPGLRFELSNELERPVFEKHLCLAELKSWLSLPPEVGAALMSGSGSTIFAVLREKDLGFTLGSRIAKQFGENLWVYLCETIPSNISAG